MAEFDSDELASVIEHTNLYPDAVLQDLERLGEEATRYGFGGVCVYGGDVEHVRELVDERTSVCAVVGFPHGKSQSHVKAEEARKAVEAGADEVDMVLNQTFVKSGRMKEAVADIQAVRDAVPDATVKVICENCNLTPEEKVQAYRACEKADADFLKTSTGFGRHGAREDDIRLMAETIEDMNSDMGIKAAGGVGDRATARAMFEATGFDELDPSRFRIGTSSGVDILEETG